VWGDEYATPLHVEALMRNRGGITDFKDSTVRNKRQLSRDDESPLMRWDPWVRSCVVAQELVSCMKFDLRRAPQVISLEFAIPRANDSKGYGRVNVVRPPREVFEAQLKKVLDWAELREERMAEIIAQIEDQAPFWGSLLPIQTDRLRHTRELIDAVVQFTIFAEMRFKHEFACWRPCDLSIQVQPVLTTPGHGTFPSGHCTQSYAILETLRALLNASKPSNTNKASARYFNVQGRRLAARIATNRVIAGVHFPVDNLVGRFLGTALGQYFAYVAGGSDTGWIHGTFDGGKLDGSEEFLPNDFNTEPGDYGYYTVAPFDDPPERAKKTAAQMLWDEAAKECERITAFY